MRTFTPRISTSSLAVRQKLDPAWSAHDLLDRRVDEDGSLRRRPTARMLEKNASRPPVIALRVVSFPATRAGIDGELALRQRLAADARVRDDDHDVVGRLRAARAPPSRRNSRTARAAPSARADASSPACWYSGSEARSRGCPVEHRRPHLARHAEQLRSTGAAADPTALTKSPAARRRRPSSHRAGPRDLLDVAPHALEAARREAVARKLAEQRVVGRILLSRWRSTTAPPRAESSGNAARRGPFRNRSGCSRSDDVGVLVTPQRVMMFRVFQWIGASRRSRVQASCG